jgi:cell division protein FtsW (lipid II flippase)
MENWFKENIDYTILIVVFLLLVIGVISIYSATYDAGASAFFNRQIIWAGI